MTSELYLFLGYDIQKIIVMPWDSQIFGPLEKI